MHSTEKLITMANQIARNLAVQGEDRAIAATTDHIKRFWNTRMREAILQADLAAEEVHPIARKALERLATRPH